MEIKNKFRIRGISQKSRRTVEHKKLIAPIFFLIMFLVVWGSVIEIFDIQRIILPGPLDVCMEIISNFSTLVENAFYTLMESVAGFLIANLLGFSLAILFAHSKFFEEGLYPYAIALKTTPIIAMAPILILWFGSGILSKIVASSLICFFPMLVNTSKGLRSIDEESLDLFESLGASKKQIFRKLRFPNSLPQMFSALKISSSLSVVGAIVGEFVGADIGLGYMIVVSSYHFNMAAMFAAVIFSALIGVLLFRIISLIEKKFSYWEYEITDEGVVL